MKHCEPGGCCCPSGFISYNLTGGSSKAYFDNNGGAAPPWYLSLPGNYCLGADYTRGTLIMADRVAFQANDTGSTPRVYEVFPWKTGSARIGNTLLTASQLNAMLVDRVVTYWTASSPYFLQPDGTGSGKNYQGTLVIGHEVVKYDYESQSFYGRTVLNNGGTFGTVWRAGGGGARPNYLDKPGDADVVGYKIDSIVAEGWGAAYVHGEIPLPAFVSLCQVIYSRTITGQQYYNRGSGRTLFSMTQGSCAQQFYVQDGNHLFWNNNMPAPVNDLINPRQVFFVNGSERINCDQLEHPDFRKAVNYFSTVFTNKLCYAGPYDVPPPCPISYTNLWGSGPDSFMITPGGELYFTFNQRMYSGSGAVQKFTSDVGSGLTAYAWKDNESFVLLGNRFITIEHPPTEGEVFRSKPLVGYITDSGVNVVTVVPNA